MIGYRISCISHEDQIKRYWGRRAAFWTPDIHSAQVYAHDSALLEFADLSRILADGYDLTLERP